MKIVVDANVAIAVLDPCHRFHRSAVRRCLAADDVAILNLTRAEALIHPSRSGKLVEADAALGRLGFRTVPLADDVADCARELRADYGDRSFPLVDAVVVAFGVVNSVPVVTCDQKWPEIGEVAVELLTGELLTAE